ncbi:MAG: hypothetical protein WAN48_11735 [Actinomycetes bacterium]
MTPSAQLACPQCGALSRPDAAWCSLCLTRFDAEDLAETGSHDARPADVPPDPLTAPLEQLVAADEGTDPSAASEPATPELTPEPRPEPVAPRGRLDSELVDTMLAQLAAEVHERDAAAPLAGKLSDKGTRTVVSIGGAVIVTVVIFVLFTILGAVT